MSILTNNETIAAIATPIGTGGVGIIRISGKDSFDIIKKIFVPFSDFDLKHKKIYFGKIYDKNILVDEVIVLVFRAPNSFTGEDVIEIQSHGGICIVKEILNICLKNGAKMASRGEFTKRAFLNQKLDLTQAEAVLDLINAKTSKAMQKSALNLEGRLSIEIKEIKQKLLSLLAKIVAALDFPEDVEEPSYDFISEETTFCLEKINSILKTSKCSNLFRQGLNIVIVGRPNVGKSSLFNSLLDMNRAIVSDIAGTTRDIIQESIDLEGLPVTLSDTAGIRFGAEITDEIEKIGIDYSQELLNKADLILFVFDGNTGMDKDDEIIYEQVKNKNHLKIASKADLGDFTYPDTINISTMNKKTLENLKNIILQKIQTDNFHEMDFITNIRQEECLNKSKQYLEDVLEAANNLQLQDLISIDIKSALYSLDECIGENINEEVLDHIFEQFCIGK